MMKDRILRIASCLVVTVAMTSRVAARAADDADPSAVADDGAHAAGHGTHPAEPNPLTFDPDLAIFTGIVFVVLLGVLGKFAWPVIVEALDERERRIEEHIAAAEQNNQQSQDLLAQHEERLAKTADEVRALMEEARRDAEATRTQILAEAKTAAQAEHDRALREIRNATDSALKMLAETSAAHALDLAGKIVQQTLSPSDHERLIREALGEFPNMN